MFKFFVPSLCGLSLASSVYLTGWTGNCSGDSCSDGDCCDTPSRASAMVATDTINAVDVKNTKCIVSGSDPMGAGPGPTAVYKGKIYHFCCDDCVPTFKKDPEKYIKALEADPAKFGVKQ